MVELRRRPEAEISFFNGTGAGTPGQVSAMFRCTSVSNRLVGLCRYPGFLANRLPLVVDEGRIGRHACERHGED
jgi:hypothetical protein